MQISIKMLSFLISYHIQGLHSVTSGERMANLHGDDENEYLAIYWIIGLACTGWDHSGIIGKFYSNRLTYFI